MAVGQAPAGGRVTSTFRFFPNGVVQMQLGTTGNQYTPVGSGVLLRGVITDLTVKTCSCVTRVVMALLKCNLVPALSIFRALTRSPWVT